MLPVLRITLAIILAIYVVVKFVDGNQIIVHVSELISDEEDYGVSGEIDIYPNMCCAYGNCSCNSLDHALAYLTSNVLINITTDVLLSSIITINISDLENISIIGHNNPTVICKNVGGIHFTFCHNCIIQGITWDGCGAKRRGNSVIKFNNFSNITIKNCTFQNSKGQAIVLSGVAGDVNIDHCNFVYNSHYKGHGAAIYYSTSNKYLQNSFTVSNCNFTHNKGANSLVYIKSRISEHNDNITIQYSKFCHNQGVSVYVINQNLHFNGTVLFQNNTAENGTGIYIRDHSTAIFDENSNVKFILNSASFSGAFTYESDSNGGAIYSRPAPIMPALFEA